MKQKIGVISCLLVIGLLSGCSSDKQPKEHTENSTSKDVVSISENEHNTNENNNPQMTISNTSKLNFDDAVISIPDLSQVKSVEFERCDWTKTELTNSFVDTANSFATDNNYMKISSNNLTFDYIDSIEGDKGEVIGRNFYSVYTDSPQFSASYNHYSCFFRAYSKSADFSSISGKSISYFSDNTDKALVDKATSIMKSVTSEYDSFFNNVDLELFPFSYEVKDDIKHFKYGVSYKGIPLDTSYYSSIDHDILDVHMGSNFSEVIVDNDDNLLSVLSSYKWKVTEKEAISDIISLEKACQVVDSNISKNVVFDVSRVDFLYKVPEVLDDSEQVVRWQGVPCWKITIDATGIGEYQRLAFFVDAVTGDFSTYEIAM